MMKKCKNCQTDNRDIARYCKCCGAQMTASDEKIFQQVVGKREILDELVDMVNLYQFDKQNGISTNMNVLIMGNTGSGKTFLANVIKDYFFSKGVISHPEMTRVDASEFENWWQQFLDEEEDPEAPSHEGEIFLLDNVHLLMDNARGLTPIDSLFGKMETWEREANDMGVRPPIIILAGDKEFMASFFEVKKNAKMRFAKSFVLGDYSVDELSELCEKSLLQYRMTLSPEARTKMFGYFRYLVKHRDVEFRNGHESIEKAKDIRLVAFKNGHTNQAQPEDVQGNIYETRTPQDILKELDQFVGLESVKKEVHSWVNNIEQYRKETGNPNAFPPFRDHFMFLGNPGTGKTTIARIFANILDALGILPIGQLVEVSREDLVAAYIGQTAIQTAKVVESAMGGVLFIDEAYTLAQGGDNDFGREAINALLKPVEDRRGEFVCIIAGYTKEMHDFVSANPGIADRFNKSLTFEDYTAKDMTTIFLSLVHKEGYTLDDEAMERLPKFFERVYATRTANFGNARAVRNIFRKAENNYRQRVSTQQLPSNKVLTRIDIEGVEGVQELSVESILEKMDREFVGMEEVKTFVQEVATQKADIDERLAHGLPVKQTMKLNIVLTGNPGTGKTTVARKLGELLHAMKLLPSSDVIECTRNDIVTTYMNSAGENMRKMCDRAMGKLLFIDEAYEFAPVNDTGTKDAEATKALEELMVRMENDAGKFAVVLAGYPGKMDNFLKANEGIPRRITHRINIKDYTAEQLAEIFRRMAKKTELKLSPEADETLLKKVNEMLLAKDSSWGNAGEMAKLLEQVKAKQAVRIKQVDKDARTAELYCTIEAADIPFEKAKKIDAEEALAKLNEMVGLTNIKKQLSEMISSFRVAERRAALKGEKVKREAHHYIFMGNPGTGKTTVAQLMADILTSLGVLSRGHLVTVTEKDLVSGYVSQTATKTNNVIDSAMGGVLFIDEAYTLSSNKGANSFGQDAINALLPRLTADNGKFVCILAGYKKEMNEFLQTNSGLARRFTTIDFEDYLPDELEQIFRNILKKNDMRLDDFADKNLSAFFSELYDKRDPDSFGNAGAVVNIFKAAKERQGARVEAAQFADDDEQMNVMTMEDISGKKAVDIPAKEIVEQQLLGLSGMDEVKAQIDTMLKQIRIAKKRAELTKRPFVNHNTCIALVGDKDCGQMEVLDLLAKLLYYEGVVGDPAITHANLEVSPYGVDVESMRSMVNQASSDVVVLDDLAEGLSSGMGAQLLDVLSSVIGEKNGRIYYVAQFTAPQWENLSACHPQLAKLFTLSFQFSGLTPGALTSKFIAYVQENGMTLTDDAKDACVAYFTHHLEEGVDAVEPLFNLALERQDYRLAQLGDFDNEQLTYFTVEDIPQD